MRRPQTPLFSLAKEATEAGGGGGGSALASMVATKITGIPPGAAALLSKWKKPEADKPVIDAVIVEDGKSVEDKPIEDGKTVEDKTADGDEVEDDPADEIKAEDIAEVQLAKLRKAQKKALSRIDKITATKVALETENATLKAASPAAKEEPNSGAFPSLPGTDTHEALNTMEGQIRKHLEWCRANLAQGATVKDAAGNDTLITPAQIAKELSDWTDVLVDDVPAKRQFLKDAESSAASAAEMFKPWQAKKEFTAAKEAATKMLKPIKSLMPQYELMLNQVAFAQMVLGGDMTVMPKAKAAAKPASSADAATPTKMIESATPPVKPAGSANLDDLKQAMMKNPNNGAARTAFIRAQLAATRK